MERPLRGPFSVHIFAARRAGELTNIQRTFTLPLMALTLRDKLAILSDAAKYDAPCASSGGEKRDSRKGGLGSSGGAGICHAYTPDGRCISFLKILMTNFCIFDCA